MDYMDFVKNAEDINKMRHGGKILAETLSELKKMLVPGRDSLDLEKEFIKMCSKNKVAPTCKGYSPHGMPEFPTGLCLSINDQSVHCFPKKHKQPKKPVSEYGRKSTLRNYFRSGSRRTHWQD